MDTVYPPSASALARGRRLRRTEPRLRQRTTPVTFAEIKEVDEESAEAELCGERRRPDVLEERLGRQFAEFRRRRARRDLLREHESPPPAAALHGSPHGFPYGPSHGSPHGPPHGSPHGPPHGPLHGPTHGPTQGSPHGPTHGSPHGPTHGSPHGPTHGSPHGLPRAGSEPAALHRQAQP